MRIENGLIVSATRTELWHRYLECTGIDEIMDFNEYLYRLIYFCGVKIEEE